MRVASLLPSATEILCLVGGASLLVGRSHECDHPAGLDHLSVLTSARTALGVKPGAAREVDRLVRQDRDAEDSLYVLDTETLEALRPDIILTQDLCDVCAIHLPAVEAAARAIAASTGRTPAVVTLRPETPEDVYDDCLRIGEVIGRTADATRAVAALRERFFAAADIVATFGPAPVVGFLEWTDPLFIAGHWNVQLIERAGGRHPLNETVAKHQAGAAIGPMQSERVAGRSIAVPPEVFAATAPEALVIAPCGLDLAQTRRVAAELAENAWFVDLPAVRTGRVALVNGNQMFNRPGPRLVDAFEWLVAWLHDRPDRMPAGFPWEPMDLR
ncbi:MAG: ABC transporter substrate-binding protein [Planctomycetota bacterium]